VGESVPNLHPHHSPLWILKCGLTVPKIANIGNFWYKFAQKGYPLKRFYKIWHREGGQGPHPHATFHRCGFKNVGLEPQKSQKLVIFGTNLHH